MSCLDGGIIHEHRRETTMTDRERRTLRRAIERHKYLEIMDEVPADTSFAVLAAARSCATPSRTPASGQKTFLRLVRMSRSSGEMATFPLASASA